jgi:hypothetical protein
MSCIFLGEVDQSRFFNKCFCEQPQTGLPMGPTSVLPFLLRRNQLSLPPQ